MLSRTAGAIGLVLACLCTSNALFEDQAGKVDWYRKHIGKVSHALFHATGQQRLALVATEASVVAGLDLRSGSIVWRSVLSAHEKVMLLQLHGKVLLSVSSGVSGAFVRAWGVLGGLAWDAHIPHVPSPAEGAEGAPDAVVAGGTVIVCWQSRVRAFHIGTGELLWEWSAEATQLLKLIVPTKGEPPSDALSTSTSGEKLSAVHVYGVTTNGDVSLTVLEPKDGGRAVTAGSPSTIKAHGATPSATMLATLDRSSLLMLDASATKLILCDVGSTACKVHAVPGLALGATASLQPWALPRMAVVATSDGASMMLKLGDAKTPPEVVTTTEATPHVFAHTTSREGRAVVALATLATAQAAVQLRVLHVEADGAYGEWSADEPLPYDVSDLGAPSNGWLNTYTRKDGSFGHRLLLSSVDHSLQLLQAVQGEAGKQSWLRPEALATVQSSEITPLPALVDAEGSERPSFSFAIPALVEGFRRQLAKATAGPAAAAGSDAGPPPAHADAYGFRQAVIATTSAGKVFGLHATDGSVLWSRLIASPDADADAPAALPFSFLCRGGGAPHALVIAQGESRWGVNELNPFNGKEVTPPSGAMSADGTVVHAARLDLLAPDDGSARAPLMIVDDSLGVHVYPKEMLGDVSGRLGDIFFYLHNASAGSLTGYSVGKGADGKLIARPRWSMALPASAGSAGARAPVTFASFPHAAAVHSPVRVLGDRNVLHKYINRNLLALGVELAGDGEFEEPSVQVMLLDTVSGRVVHSVTHVGMQGPLTLLMGENWVVTHFWSPKSLTYQMTVAELFRNSSIADDLASLVVGGGPDYSLRKNGFDGFVHPHPHVLTQGYAFGAPIEAMAVTQTVAGITPKFILAATVAGQMVLLDKRFLDPRRPIVPGGPAKMAQADREEGLVPYGPSLGGISPLAVVSHHNAVARPRHIIAAPTYLESTSLALMIGLDLFMTRVAPAREFDRLNEDFNYFALVCAIIGLTVATVGSGWVSNGRDLARGWK